MATLSTCCGLASSLGCMLAPGHVGFRDRQLRGLENLWAIHSSLTLLHFHFLPIYEGIVVFLSSRVHKFWFSLVYFVTDTESGNVHIASFSQNWILRPKYLFEGLLMMRLWVSILARKLGRVFLGLGLTFYNYNSSHLGFFFVRAPINWKIP